MTRLWAALPAWLRSALVWIGALAVGALALVRYGRHAELAAAAEASARERMGDARRRADEVLAAADAGDDADVQRRLAAASDRAKRATGR